MSSFIRFSTSTLALCGAVLASPLSAAEGEELRYRADIAFARGLATEWQFIDLAESLLDGLESGTVPPDVREELALSKCDVFAEGAKTEPKAERREELYDKAIASYRDFLERYEYGDFGEAAERAYVDLANAYGVFMSGNLEEAVGEDVARIRGRIDDVLNDAVERTAELIAGYKSKGDDRSERETQEMHTLMYNRAQLYFNIAKTAEEGAFYYAQAEEVLEDLAFSAGETSAFGLYSYMLLGDVYIAQGQMRDAYDYLEFVVNTGIPKDPGTWGQLKEAQTRDQLQQRWQIVEIAMRGLIESCLAQGNTDDSLAWGLYYYNTWSREGFNMSPRGYLSLLAVARALLDAGGYVGGRPGETKWFETEDGMKSAGFTSRREQQTGQGLSMALAEIVNRENRGDILQVRAQKLISEIISRPGVTVSPNVLYEAAQGEYNDKNYAGAVAAFKRALAAIEKEDEATKIEFGPKVLHSLGKCYQRMDRQLEAAMVFREATQNWTGDPKYDVDNANSYQDAISAVQRTAKGDPLIDNLRREAEDIVSRVDSENAGDIVFRQARRFWDEKDYQAARSKFKEVPANADSYEPALTYAAVCLEKMDQDDAAQRELVNYLNVFVVDAVNKLSDKNKLNKREEARAQATFYLAKIANGRKDYARVIELLDGYEEAFPTQTSYTAAALGMLVGAHLGVGDFDSARDAHKILVENFRDSVFTGHSSIQMYKVLSAEHDKAVDAKDDERARDLLQRMADNVKLANELTDKPTFSNLRAESKHWYDLGQWEASRSALRRILSRNDAGAFADMKDIDDQMERFVLPDLAHAELELGNVADAFEILDQLVPDPDDKDKKAASQTVLDYCRAVTGWVTGGEGEFREVPGVGDAALFEKATSWLAKITNSMEKWQCDWYGRKFELAYGYYQWGKVDSAKKESAMRQVATLRTELGNDLRGGGGIPGIQDACGDDVLRQRFMTLWDLVQ